MTNVILCGGAGTRLWPLSRRSFPKQFCDLLGGPSLYELTVARNAALADSLLVVANRDHFGLAREQLLGAAPAGKGASFILEPLGRNTAPAIALACLGLEPGEVVLVTPSDHVIADEAAYRKACETALAAAEEGYLVTFGLEPAYPETGYGYIEAGESLPGKAFRCVASFKEKPDRAKAEAYVAAGGFYWNSGMFAFKAGRFLEELGASAPDILAASRAAFEACGGGSLREGFRVYEPGEAEMGRIRADSIDYAVMEKSERAAVVPCSIGWSDLGSWDSIYELRAKDPAGNAAGDETLSLGAKHCLVLSGGKRVVLVGLEDCLVVDTPDALLVARRGESQRVKEAVEALRKGGPADAALLE